KLAECIDGIEIEGMDCEICSRMQEILMDEIDDPTFLDFAIENIDELLSYIESGRINIRIHSDIAGEMWFGVGQKAKP
ncbi:MAG: hypothetical protein GY797_04975, partial [Deltaproteobacteria bacterium]|nr:hypothetical protein [Deltaproteobacteria bacterium]